MDDVTLSGYVRLQSVMDSITLRLQPHTIESLEEEANERDVSRSEYVRDIVRSRNELQRLRDEHERIRNEYEQRIEELQADHAAEIDKLETENERLRNEKQLILEQRKENTELARYVEDELSYREAGLGTRIKWWLFGKKKTGN